MGLSVSAQRSVSPNRSFSRSASVAEYRRLAGSILIWQRSAIASTCWPLVSLIRSTSDRAGTTAYRSTLAPMQSKASSATSALLRRRWSWPRHPALCWSWPRHPALCWSWPRHPALCWSWPRHPALCWSWPRHPALCWSWPRHPALCWSWPRHPAQGPRPGADVVEEFGQALPGLLPAVETAPVQSHPPGELITGVDRHHEVLHAGVGAADQRGLHVRCHGGQQRVLRGEPVPGRQVEPALRRASGAGVEAGHLVRRGTAQEE